MALQLLQRNENEREVWLQCSVNSSFFNLPTLFLSWHYSAKALMIQKTASLDLCILHKESKTLNVVFTGVEKTWLLFTYFKLFSWSEKCVCREVCFDWQYKYVFFNNIYEHSSLLQKESSSITFGAVSYTTKNIFNIQARVTAIKLPGMNLFESFDCLQCSKGRLWVAFVPQI